MTYLFVVVVTFACQGNYYFDFDNTFKTKDEAIEFYNEQKGKKDLNVSEPHFNPENDKDYKDCIISNIQTGKRTEVKDKELDEAKKVRREAARESAPSKDEEPDRELDSNQVIEIRNHNEEAQNEN